MCGQKKRPPESGNSQAVRGGLAPSNDSRIIIAQFREKRKPQFPRGRRCPLHDMGACADDHRRRDAGPPAVSDYRQN